MVSSAKIPASAKLREVQAKRDNFRRLLLENLERRELMANNIAAPVFASGTPQNYVDQTLQSLGSNTSTTRWTSPIGGASLIQGDAATISWSIVPDGTQVADGIAGGAAQSSNLIAFMDGIYGGTPGPLTQKPWFPIVERAYQRWSELSGVTFVYEPSDDGVPSSVGNRGVAGVRGDIRLGGRAIDGDAGILAYSYYPNNGGTQGLDGDMVLDTGDNYFGLNAQSPTAENKALFNALMHEIGHSIGMEYVIPGSQTKLMEPISSLAYLGAQLEDIVAAQTLYGDDAESDDSIASSRNLGLLGNGITNFQNRSIDNASDTDFSVFTLPGAARVSISVTPVGKTSLVGPYGGTAALTDSLRNKDLSFVLETTSGTVIRTVNAKGLGEVEEIIDERLSVGSYRLRVTGTGSSRTQLYDLSIRVSGIVGPQADQLAPRLLSVAPNSGEIFGINRINVLSESPRELVFRFDGSQKLDRLTLSSGIIITRSGGDGQFGQANDAVITPAWLDFGDNERIVIARFAAPLPDDVYRIEVTNAIRNTDGTPLRPRKSGTDRDTLFMNLELGAQVLAVVPQPVTRNAAGQLVPSRNTIEVYFNNDDLGATASNPSFYKLILTKDTVSPNDDVEIPVSSVVYDPANDMATLTFSDAIETLGGTGTYRLRIGSNESVATAAQQIVPVQLNFGPDVGNTVDAAQTLTATPFSTAQSFIVTSEVRMNGQALPDYPGSNFEPGHRDIRDESHLDGAADASSDISTMTYSFLFNQTYGNDSAGRPVITTITPDQVARVREIFELLSAQWGIDFVETAGPGDLNIVVGDMAPNGETSGPLGVLGVASNGLAIMDQSEAWDNSFGNGLGLPNTQNFFNTAFHEIMHLLGLGHAYDQPAGTIMGGGENINPNTQDVGRAEWFFPGNVDTIHGQHLFRPDNKDVDMYRFDVPAGTSGSLSLETIAERLGDSSLVDTHLTLLKRAPNGRFDIVALNDNYFSKDSMIRTTVDGGTTGAEYYIAVTSRGNENFDPLVDMTGNGSVSAGSYQLKVDFKPALVSSILDTTGTPIDGDGDGKAGGNFDFWFRAAPVGGPSTQPRTIFVDKQYTGAVSNGAPLTPYKTIPAATGAAKDGDIIRVVGTIGADRQLGTTRDNRAYEIGVNRTTNATLSDGKLLEVPKGVTLMIDAGAIFKVAGSEIVAGSPDASNDRSGGAIQVLGKPSVPVYFTSYYDETIGTDTNSLPTTPAPGDWGGLEFRLDADRAQGRRDREREGVFLNYVAFGDLKYGGGQIGEGLQTRVVNPIHMTESRPTILNSTFRFNADAGISADPNSLEETTFSEPRYHITGEFTPDYNRVGPVLRGNTFANNTINGLQIRIDTLAGSTLKPLSVSGRIDDTDITYFLGENLIIAGTPGGPVVENVRPNVAPIQRTPTTGGTLPAGDVYNYRITYIDRFGGESVFSLPTPNVTVDAGGAIRLSTLPAATGDFVGRRIWRSQNGGIGPYTLVAEINKDSISYTDIGTSIGGSVDPNALPAATLRARRDATLVIDPGVVIKSRSARIEVGMGATLLAEGTESKPIIFTSRLDDRYGAGGTFDLNNDGATTVPAATNWAGIVARHLSNLSIDHSLITFAGGSSTIEGGFAFFNAVEIHQANARIAHSVLENNGSGFNLGGPTRAAIGPNEAAVIYVVGSQPVIVDNIIRDNTLVNNSNRTAAISIDANSMKAISVTDMGRNTGTNDRVDYGLGNMGPLIQKNRLGNNSINGVVVRGGVLTTETVWDDTDIVHVLTSNIAIPNFHTYGGMRLQSKANESLVVKLSGPNAGITATGAPLDVPGRIGGSLQVIGALGFPVIMTSLTDDTIGAGFDPDGRSQVDTDGAGATVGVAGGWRGLLLDSYSNDRNVDTNFELEADKIQDRKVNDFPDIAQSIGQLAPNVSGGDENLRLGFTVHGTIAAPSDLDVYKFSAAAGTQIWIDLDRTGSGLDAVVEVIDANGEILALSDNSFEESSARQIHLNNALLNPDRALPMDSSAFAHANAQNATAQVDFQGINPLDAGLRIVLPGVAGTVNPYYIRVRSSSRLPGEPLSKLLIDNELLNGITTGPYRMQVRLQQQDEIGGSTVRFADIRFATNGIQLIGLPGHSPLLGESSEISDGAGIDEQPGGAQPIGNLGNSDRAAISVAGNIVANPNNPDVDWFRFRIHRDGVQIENQNHLSTVFDLDYADGVGRVDATLWVYKLNGNIPELVLIGTDSNIADDQAAPNRGSNSDDLSRGSFGARDPFIGAAELPNGEYLVAVTSSSLADRQMSQFERPDANDPSSIPLNTGLRIEPVTSVRRYSVDRFGGNVTGTEGGAITVSFGNFENDPAASTYQNATPFSLADVTAFVVTTSGLTSTANFSNAFTGNLDAIVGSGFARTTDIAVSPTGLARGFNPANGNQTDQAPGNFLNIDIRGNGATSVIGTSGIQTFENDPANPGTAIVANNGNGHGMVFTALNWANEGNSATMTLWGVASRGNNVQTYQSVNLVNVDARNYLYRLNDAGVAQSAGGVDRTADARATGAGTQIQEYAHFNSAGTITGLAESRDVMFAVSDVGELFRVNAGNYGAVFGNPTLVRIVRDAANNPIEFTSLRAGPRNLSDGVNTSYQDLLFGLATDGRLYAFNKQGILQPIFPQGATSILMELEPGQALEGIDFSALDMNLWHLNNSRGANAGHGVPAAFDGSRSRSNGGTALAFAYSSALNGDWLDEYRRANSDYDLPGGAHGAVESDLIDLRGYSADDQPMLYFNYFLDTENSSADKNGRMRDSLRVYGGGPNGTWMLLATNNSSDDNQYDTVAAAAQNEFDPAFSRYKDSFGKNYKPQELFAGGNPTDANAWRQARVNLAPFAGQHNVRLRFEFSTEGDYGTENAGRRYGVELTAVQPAELLDGDTFTIQRGNVPFVFEFDMGLVLNLPSGASIAPGSVLTVEGVQFTFVTTVTGANQIQFDPANTPAQIAIATSDALTNAGFDVFTNVLSPNILNVKAGATANGIHNVIGLDPAIIAGTPGVAIGNVPVDVHQAMNITEARDAIRSALAQALNNVGQETNLIPYPVSGNSVRVFNVTIPAGGLGKLGGLRAARPGDAFQPDVDLFGNDDTTAVRQSRAARAQNNGGTGVFIDDIIIGFAERGEMVSGYAADLTANGGGVTMLGNRLLAAGGLIGGQDPSIDPTLTGNYQLEIRTAASYGISNSPTDLSFIPVPGEPTPRSFDTNERLAQQAVIEILTASGIADGAEMTLSDGYNTASYEFDVITSFTDPAAGVKPENIPILIDPGFTVAQVAEAIRDAINGISSQAILKITASVNGKNPLPQFPPNIIANNSSLVYLHGPAATNLFGGTDDLLDALRFKIQGTDSDMGEDLGDANRLRDQGQVVIQSTYVRDSLNFGIVVDAGARNLPSTSPRAYPGSPRNLVTLNFENYAPGVVLMNNVLERGGQGGIQVSGDNVNPSINTPASIARVINNTIVGANLGTGIAVNEGATPTILNNIFSNLAVGISVDNVSRGVELGANIYQLNGSNTSPNISIAASDIPLTSSEPLFLDPTNGRYYLRDRSKAIDSSLASLLERPALKQVKNSVQLPESPMIAPTRDIGGLLRVDDPDNNPSDGAGQTVTIDRGAVDRADFAGPKAVLINPLDNDSKDVDVDRNSTYVRLLDGNLSYFSVLLDESQGTGPNPASINANSLILTENGRVLKPDIDYIFAYSSNSREIRITPLAGFWRRDSVYEITLNNLRRVRLDATSGDRVSDGDNLRVTLNDGAEVTLEYESGIVLQVPQTLTLVVPAAGAGPLGITDGQRLRIRNGALDVDFEFDTDGFVSNGTRPIVIPAIATATQVRDAIITALQLPTNSDLNLAPKAFGPNKVSLGVLSQHGVTISNSLVTVEGISAGVEDGQTFTVARVGKPSITFEFNLQGDTNFTAGNTLITILRSDTFEDVAEKIALALGPVFAGGFAPVSHIAGGYIQAGGSTGDVVTAGLSKLIVTGVPGVTSSLELTVPATGGAGIVDGQQFSIGSGATTVVFEFTKNLTTNPGTFPITISNSDSAATVAQRIALAVKNSALGFNSVATADKVKLNEPLGTVFNALTSGLVFTGVPGGAVAVPFVPSATFDAGLMGGQLTKALNQIGLNVKAVAVGVGTILIDGISSITDGVVIDPVVDYAGNVLLPNRANSLTQFTIVMPEVTLDYGDAAGAGSETLDVENGARHALLPEDEPLLVLGNFADADADGQLDTAAQGDDVDSLVLLTAPNSMPFTIGTPGPALLRLPAPSVALIGKTVDVKDSRFTTVQFEFVNGAVASAGKVAVNISTAVLADDVASAFANAVFQQVLAGTLVDLIPIANGDLVTLGGTSKHEVSLANAGGLVQRLTQGRLELGVLPTIAGNYVDGRVLTLLDGSGNVVTFELNNTATNTPVALNNVAINVNLSTVTPAALATSIANAINAQIDAGALRLPKATVAGTTITILADDEEGVTFGGLFNENANPVPITLLSSGTGVADAWIDWNNNGSFQDPGEQILSSTPIRAGSNTFLVQTPAGASVGFTNARFRLSTVGGLLTNGVGIGGEVEDYKIEILAGTPPVGTNDAYSVNEDLVLSVPTRGVLLNDTDAETPTTITVYDSDPTVAGVQPAVAPLHGTLVLNANGSFVYDSDPDYWGPDSFVYYPFDGRFVSNQPVTVSLTVNPVNDAPTAVDDTIAILEDEVIRRPGSIFWSNDIKGPPNESGQFLRLVNATIVSPRGNGETVSVVNDELRYTPPAEYNNRLGGPVLLELTIRDGGVAGGDANPLESKSILTINIAEINDAPTYSMPLTTSTIEDGGLITIPTFVTSLLPGPALATDEVTIDNQVVGFQLRAIDPTLFSVQPRIINNLNGTARLEYRLAPDVNNLNRPNPANLRVEVIASDNGLDAPPPNEADAVPRTFTISVTSINDAPTFVLSNPNPAVIEDAGIQVVNGFATSILPGPPTADDEANQTLTFTLTPRDPSAFRTPPSMTSTGILTYELAQDVNSRFKDLTVDVVLTDNGATGGLNVNTSTQSFSIVAAHINDAPDFTLGNLQVPALEDNEAETGVTPTTFINFATSIVKGPATALDEPIFQNVSFSVISVSRPELFSTLPAISPTGTLTFVTAKDQNGSAVIVVQLVDTESGTAPNINVSELKTFTINLTAVNDAPEFTVPTTVNSIEDQGVVRILNFATGMRPGPTTAADESGQTFTVNVVAKDPSKFIVQPTISADGTLQFRTGPDVNSANADLRVEVFLQDNGPSTAPNKNRSAVQTFTIVTSQVNDAPLFAIPDKQVPAVEDQEVFTGVTPTVIPNFVNGILMGPPTATDEVGQLPTFIVAATAPELFAVQPSIDANGALRFVTAPNKNGRSLILIRLRDSGLGTPTPNNNLSLEQTATITIAAINDAPEFDIPASLTVNEDSGLVSIAGFAFNVLRGPIGADDENGQLIEFVATAIDPTAFEVQPSLLPDGTLSFKTAKDINRLSGLNTRIQVVLKDNGVASPAPNTNTSIAKTFNVDIAPVNDPPIPDSLVVPGVEDTELTVTAAAALAGDVPGPIDELGQTLKITQVERTSDRGGTITPVFSGPDIVSFKYTPATNVVGLDFFRYIVTDNGSPARSASGTITINIAGTNDAPQFSSGPNLVTVVEDSGASSATWATNILAGPPGALDENEGPNKQTVSFIVTTNRPGMFSQAPAIDSNGVLTFTPSADANGSAIVTVIAQDSGSGVAPNVNVSPAVSFTINITAVNDAPVFTSGGNLTVDEDTSAYDSPWATGIKAAAGLPATATDELGQLISFVVTTDRPSMFAVAPTVAADGNLKFVLASNANGAARIVVAARDNGPSEGINQNLSASQTFTLTVNAVNDVPEGTTDTFDSSEDVLLTIGAPGLLSNDGDIDLPNDILKAVVATTTSSLGVPVTVNADGSFTYDPRNVEAIQKLFDGQFVTDRFTYTIEDAAGGVSNPVTVIVRISGVNDAPVANNDQFQVAAGVKTLLPVLSNDTDQDTQLDPTSIQIGDLPLNGKVTVSLTGVVEYTANAGFRGTDEFSYRVRDVRGLLSNEAKVSINTNTPPSAVNDFVTTGKDQAITINVLRNDFDSEDITLVPTSVQVVVNSSSGTTEVLSDGRVKFTPVLGFVGNATFSYVAADTAGAFSNVAVVNVRVTNTIYQNPANKLDVNADGNISPIDALLVINYVNLNGAVVLPPTAFAPPPYLDVNGDNRVAPIDALEVINFLNLRGNSEGEGEASGTVDVAMVSPEQMLATVGPSVMTQVREVVADTLAEYADEIATVPATKTYPTGRLSDVYLPQGETLEEALAHIAGADSQMKKRKSSVDQVFAGLEEDLLT